MGGPAVSFLNNEVILAWGGGGGPGGGPPDERLNIKHGLTSNDPRTWQKFTLNDFTNQSVSMTQFGGRLYMGWRGTDGAGHLNLRSGVNPLDLATNTDKQILSDTSGSGPALAAHRGFLVRAWTGTDRSSGTGHVNVALSSDGLTWPDQNRMVLNQIAFTPPALLNTNDDAGDEFFYLAWTDINDHIGVTVINNGRFDQLGVNTTVLQTNGTPETSFNGPGLGAFNDGNFAAPDQVIISCAGINGARSINIMNTQTATLDFAFKTIWAEEAQSNVSEFRVGSDLLYAYEGTDTIGTLFLVVQR